MQMVRRGSVYNFEAPQSADPGSLSIFKGIRIKPSAKVCIPLGDDKDRYCYFCAGNTNGQIVCFKITEKKMSKILV